MNLLTKNTGINMSKRRKRIKCLDGVPYVLVDYIGHDKEVFTSDKDIEEDAPIKLVGGFQFVSSGSGESI